MTPFEPRDETVALWQFLELADEVRPVDFLGRVGDLASGLAGFPQTVPEIVETDPANEGKPTQRGREFIVDSNFTGVDNIVSGIGDATRLIRDFTVRAWIDYKIANHNNGDVGVVCVRGLNDGTDPERELWGMELERVDAANLILRGRWQEKDGTQVALSGVSFLKPTGFFHIAVARRWISTTEVITRYYVNDRFIGQESPNVTQDIGEGFGGTLIIGSRKSSNPIVGFTGHLPTDTVIDHLSVEGDEMSAEELRSDYLRAAVSQPSAYQRLRSYMPKGFAWTRRVESRIQRHFAAIADVLGDAIAEANRFRDDFLPDRAYGRALARWEFVTGLSPLLSDAVQDRRDRVLAFLRRILGFQIDDIKLSLELLFGLDSADIEILEYPALREDDFSVDDITTPPSKIWTTQQGNGAATVAAGECQISCGGADCRWSQGENANYRKASITSRKSEEAVGAVLITEIASITTLDAGQPVVGHEWHNIDKEVIWIGVHDNGADRELVAFVESFGVATALTVLVSPMNTVPFWLYTRYLGGGSYEFKFSTVGPATGFSAGIVINGGPLNPVAAGFGGVHRLDAGGGGIFAVSFDDAQIFEQNGVRSFAWQAFRDPLLPGEFDLLGANQQLQKQKPAHTTACAVDTKDGLELGPTGGGRLGCDPLFPLDPIIS